MRKVWHTWYAETVRKVVPWKNVCHILLVMTQGSFSWQKNTQISKGHVCPSSSMVMVCLAHILTALMPFHLNHCLQAEAWAQLAAGAALNAPV